MIKICFYEKMTINYSQFKRKYSFNYDFLFSKFLICTFLLSFYTQEFDELTTLSAYVISLILFFVSLKTQPLLVSSERYHDFFEILKNGESVIIVEKDIFDIVLNFKNYSLCNECDCIYIIRLFKSKDTSFMKESLKTFRKIKLYNYSSRESESVSFLLPKLQAILNERIFFETKKCNSAFEAKKAVKIKKIIEYLERNTTDFQIPYFYNDNKKIYLGWKSKGGITLDMKNKILYYIDFINNNYSQKLTGDIKSICENLIILLDLRTD